MTCGLWMVASVKGKTYISFMLNGEWASKCTYCRDVEALVISEVIF